MDIDLSTLTDEQLGQLRVDVLTEQERRANLAQIPATISELADQYEAGGGSRQALIDSLTTEE